MIERTISSRQLSFATVSVSLFPALAGNQCTGGAAEFAVILLLETLTLLAASCAVEYFGKTVFAPPVIAVAALFYIEICLASNGFRLLAVSQTREDGIVGMTIAFLACVVALRAAKAGCECIGRFSAVALATVAVALTLVLILSVRYVDTDMLRLSLGPLCATDVDGRMLVFIPAVVLAALSGGAEGRVSRTGAICAGIIAVFKIVIYFFFATTLGPLKNDIFSPVIYLAEICAGSLSPAVSCIARESLMGLGICAASAMLWAAKRYAGKLCRVPTVMLAMPVFAAIAFGGIA